jgi:hypothetical protein
VPTGRARGRALEREPVVPVPGTGSVPTAGTPYIIVTARIDELRRGGGGWVTIRHTWSTFVPHQSHDRRPDIRRQAVPRSEKLVECRVLPTHFREATGAISVGTMAKNRLRNAGRGCVAEQGFKASFEQIDGATGAGARGAVRLVRTTAPLGTLSKARSELGDTMWLDETKVKAECSMVGGSMDARTREPRPKHVVPERDEEQASRAHWFSEE